MILLVGCIVIIDFGWEIDVFGGVIFLCQLMEFDLYGCVDFCWWLVQVLDMMNIYLDWNKDVMNLKEDWCNLDIVFFEDKK